MGYVQYAILLLSAIVLSNCTEEGKDKAVDKRSLGYYSLYGADVGSNTHTHTHTVNTITKQVPVLQPYPVTITKQVPVAVPQPYAVHVPKPYAVPVEVKVPVEVPRPYPVTVTRHVPFPVERTVYVPKAVAVPVPQPYPVPHPVEVRVPTPVYIKDYYIGHDHARTYNLYTAGHSSYGVRYGSGGGIGYNPVWQKSW